MLSGNRKALARISATGPLGSVAGKQTRLRSTLPFSHMPATNLQLTTRNLPGLLDFVRHLGGEAPVRDDRGAVVMKIIALPEVALRRPKDMPRAQRPKAKLSKRQRAEARRAKMASLD